MARVSPTIEADSPADNTSTVVTIAATVAALYYGSEILIPIALAILISFTVAPAVKLLQKLGLGRTAPVAIVVLLTVLLFAGLAAVVGGQLRGLSSDLPRYQSTILGKIDALRSATNSDSVRRVEGAVEQFSRAVGRLGARETTPRAEGGAGQDAAADAKGAAPAPILVQVVQPAMQPLDAVMLVSAPLLHPLSLTLVVLVFVVFILLQREDLRNRAIRLFGASDLHRATAAIDDGGKRLSRYLLTQFAMNACAGVAIGTAFWLVGLPSPILLGIIFAVARFVPYIGPVLGSILPLLLAVAVDPGWSMVLWTAAALVALELALGQVIEPLVYGHNTGLSPIAIVLAATFWTVLWGPVGLFLSTPLTVCLVVLGRHVEKLAFLDVLLGDRPPLSPAETLYQRLLANDPAEAADQAQRHLGEMPLAAYFDEVALPALIMAQDDATSGHLDNERQDRIRAAAMEVLDDLEPAGEGDPIGSKPAAGNAPDGHATDLDRLVDETIPERLTRAGAVMCIGARGPLDDAAAAMLAQMMTARGIGASFASYTALSRAELPRLPTDGLSLIVVSALDGSSPAFLRFVMRRLARRAPQVERVLGAWWRGAGLRDIDAEIDQAIREPKVATLRDAVRHCAATAAGEPRPESLRPAPVVAVAS